jgi:Tfp pilus assembly protein PilF
MKHSGGLRKLWSVTALIGVALAAAVATPHGQAAQAPVPLARAVRTALGHGNLDEAKRLVQQSRDAGPRKTVAGALVAIYEGKLDEARAALAPLATDDDAVLELGLLELGRGRTAEGEALLRRIIDSQSDLDTDGFLRLARAADALGEINLANSVFQRIGSADTDRADVQSGWGDLFDKTHAPAEAARSYQDALKADPAWIPALLGAARTLDDDEPAAAAAMLAKAQELAPKSPDVWLLTAERQLAQQDFAAATASLDKVRAVRSHSIDELALRAAATYATGKPRDAEPMIAEAAALNPGNPAVYRALGNQASQLYRFDDAVTFARGAVKAAPGMAGPHSDLGTYLLRTGGEAEARTELETSFKLDPYDTIVFNLLQMLDVLEKFQVIEDGPFIFKMSQASAPVLANYAIPLAREAYAEYVKRYGFTPKGRACPD